MAVTLDGQKLDLAPGWAQGIMTKAFEESVVGKLSASKPISLTGDSIPVYTGGFEVGYTPEGTPKPVSDPGYKIARIAPKKFAGIVLVSKELARRAPSQMLEHIEADMINAVSRQVDYAILYGKSAITGEAIAETTSVNETTSRVKVDAGKPLVPQLIAAYDLAATGDSDPNGWAFDTRYRSLIAQASQAELVGKNGMPNLALPASTFAGLPTAFSRVVAGRIGKQADTGVHGFVGDWNRIYWGFAEDVSLERSTEASVVDSTGKEWHLFQDNMIGIRVEFEIGWYADKTAFAAIEKNPEA